MESGDSSSFEFLDNDLTSLFGSDPPSSPLSSTTTIDPNRALGVPSAGSTTDPAVPSVAVPVKDDSSSNPFWPEGDFEQFMKEYFPISNHTAVTSENAPPCKRISPKFIIPSADSYFQVSPSSGHDITLEAAPSPNFPTPSTWSALPVASIALDSVSSSVTSASHSRNTSISRDCPSIVATTTGTQSIAAISSNHTGTISSVPSSSRSYMLTPTIHDNIPIVMNRFHYGSRRSSDQDMSSLAGVKRVKRKMDDPKSPAFDPQAYVSSFHVPPAKKIRMQVPTSSFTDTTRLPSQRSRPPFLIPASSKTSAKERKKQESTTNMMDMVRNSAKRRGLVQSICDVMEAVEKMFQLLQEELNLTEQELDIVT
ncbi:hypothetical protein BT69DRAFT_1302425 [Atractiella rhizophila]|nr:hypothetical protein BT69DRAFT_1302425 [Atractiella rhizophila]